MYITAEKGKTYKSIILLNEMLNNVNHSFTTVNNGDDSLLEPLMVEMLAKNYLRVVGSQYEVTESGKMVFNAFMKRYFEYLKIFEVFAYVDLQQAEFAFSRYYDFDTDDQWLNFVSNPRFEDVRIAVALFKKIDPSEIVFMAYINENRFDTQNVGWQMDLLSDAVWNEIEHICETAIKPEDLGSDAMRDMINQGAELTIALLKEEQSRNATSQNNPDALNNDGPAYTQETVEYYESYYDPFYVSPIWYGPLFIW